MEVDVDFSPPPVTVACQAIRTAGLAVMGTLSGTSLLAAFGPDQAAGWVAALSSVGVTVVGLYSKLREARAKNDSAAAAAAAEAWKDRYEWERTRRETDVAEMMASLNIYKQRIADLEAMVADLRGARKLPGPPPGAAPAPGDHPDG